MNVDILKLIVVFVAFLYLNLKLRPKINSMNFWIMNTGLSFLLLASVLDFADGIQSLNNVPILGRDDPLHDILEDQFGDALGLCLFTLGSFREILRGKIG